ncbi:MAG: DUF6804 family protein [Candidatus Eremiobacterota bacterium]
MSVLIVVRVIAAALLLAGVFTAQATGYHLATQWVVFLAALMSAVLYLSKDGNALGWVLLAVAIVYNPAVPIHFDARLRGAIDVATAVLFIVPRGRASV